MTEPAGSFIQTTSGAWHWPELENVEPLELEIEPLAPAPAAARFLARYAELERRRAT